MHFTPGPIAAKKCGFRGRALALARLDTRCPLRVRRRLRAGQSCLCSLAFSAPGPISPVLGLAFLPTVGGLSIPFGCPSSPPALGFEPAFRTAVPSLGRCGTKRFLAALEQTQALPRLSCPLTGSRLTASLMWAQGSCELPTAKPRTRRLWLRSEALYLPVPVISKLRSLGFVSKPHCWMPITCKPPIAAWYPVGC
jgi:hypothetical protein